MGLCSGKPSGGEYGTYTSKVDSWTHDSRSNYMWIRDEDVANIYFVDAIIGEGSMGAVSIVRKKKDGNKSLSSTLRLSSNNVLVDAGSGLAADTDNLPPTPASTQESSQPPSEPSWASSLDLTKLERKFAMKTVAMTRMKKEEIAEFENEIEILRNLDHPNIVQLFECYRHKRKMWLVMELCTGGDLNARKNLGESAVCSIMDQLMHALAYMHKRNFCHRDLKLENVMYESPDPASLSIKLIDFGLSDTYTKGQKMARACGTIYTAAPEVLLGSTYTTQTDVWSAGVVAFVLLCEECPFMRNLEDMRDPEMVQKLREAKLQFTNPRWAGVSKKGREFVAACLRRHPGGRWRAMEAVDFIAEKWAPCIAEQEAPASPLKRLSLANLFSSTPPKPPLDPGRRQHRRIDSVMLKSFTEFSESPALKKKILMTMAYTMDKSELKELRSIFSSIDSNNEGTITLSELQTALRSQRTESALSDEQIERIFTGVDYDGSGQIHYMEFLAAAAESQGLITHERLLEAFDRMDSDDSGFISKDNLKDLLGTDYDEELADEMMGTEGRIDYEAFLEVVFNRKADSPLSP